MPPPSTKRSGDRTLKMFAIARPTALAERATARSASSSPSRSAATRSDVLRRTSLRATTFLRLVFPPSSIFSRSQRVIPTLAATFSRVPSERPGLARRMSTLI